MAKKPPANRKVKNYKEIAARKISTPRERVENRKQNNIKRPPRLFVYSRNKKGKTTFSSTAPNVIIADPEHGTDQMLESDVPSWEITRWEDIDELYQYLKMGDHPYEWVSLDGGTRMHNMALRWVMRMEEERSLTRQPGLVQQRDYGRAGEMFKGMLHNFDSLNMGVIFTCNERQEAGRDEAEDDEDSEDMAVSYVPDLPRGARASINSIVDVIGRLYVVRVDDPKNEGKKIIQRRLWIEPHPSYDTGYRSDYVLPPYVKNPTVPRMVRLIQQGRVTK